MINPNPSFSIFQVITIESLISNETEEEIKSEIEVMLKAGHSLKGVMQRIGVETHDEFAKWLWELRQEKLAEEKK